MKKQLFMRRIAEICIGVGCLLVLYCIFVSVAHIILHPEIESISVVVIHLLLASVVMADIWYLLMPGYVKVRRAQNAS